MIAARCRIRDFRSADGWRCAGVGIRDADERGGALQQKRGRVLKPLPHKGHKFAAG
jgi:hypothetical protein